jgi:ubiquinone biosynthesis protein Coq4
VNYPSSLTVAEARQRYFAENMFGDGGYDRGFTESKVGPLVVRLPNSETRKRGLRIHDLHHIATGYDTTLLGEAKVSAWELGSGGIGKYGSAKAYLYLGVLVGVFINPRAVHRAYRLGKSCRNLYHLEFSEELLSITVGELRRRTGISKDKRADKAPEPAPGPIK